jgi:hypothetical protein
MQAAPEALCHGRLRLCTASLAAKLRLEAAPVRASVRQAASSPCSSPSTRRRPPRRFRTSAGIRRHARQHAVPPGRLPRRSPSAPSSSPTPPWTPSSSTLLSAPIRPRPRLSEPRSQQLCFDSVSSGPSPTEDSVQVLHGCIQCQGPLLAQLVRSLFPPGTS